MSKYFSTFQIFFIQLGNTFNLSSLTTTGQWTILWTNLIEKVKLHSRIQLKCLQVIRILTRDKTYLNESVNEEHFDCLLNAASIGSEHHSSSSTDIQIESLKILCNLVFQSPKCQELCLRNTAVEGKYFWLLEVSGNHFVAPFSGILKRLRTYKDQNVQHDIKYYDMKLLFLITALTPNVRSKVRDDHHGLVYLVETLDLMMKNTSVKRTFGKQDVILINEILKVLFNITVTTSTTVETEEDDEQHLHRLSILLNELLSYQAESRPDTEEYQSNIINLLTNIPIVCFNELVPTATLETSLDAKTNQIYENCNMHSINVLVDFLELKLNKVFGPSASKDYEQLSPIMTVMIKSIQCSSIIRRFVKSRVLPPLTDVKRRPEEGNTMRNHLCKLLTNPSTHISDLVAELLFVLCKENVGRMIKYTGYGNAAGLFAKRGLLGGRNCEKRNIYSSDSDDSDTEEYKELKDGFNPVVGCYEPPKKNIMEEMSDEQVELSAVAQFNIF